LPILLIASLAVLSACATKPTAPALACTTSESPMAEFELLLGRNIAGRAEISEKDFLDFVTKTVVPAFPSGFSVIDADGHYGAIRERSKIITIIAPDTPETAMRIARIAASYKTRFAQESVGVVRQPVCASF
jgi:hypothetical protein